MLLKTIQEVKQVLIVSNLNSATRLPDIESAEQSYIIPAIGAELAAELQTAYDANSLSVKQKTLLKFIQKALAGFAYYDDTPMMHALVTDAGIRRTTTDNMPAVFQWEFDKLRESLVNRAQQGLEQAMAYMEANAADFPTWTASDSYAQRISLLIKSPTDFNRQYTISQMFRTYALLVPILRDVENFFIEPVIGKPFLDALKAITAPTTDEQPAIDDLKKAIAHFAVRQAIEKLPVRISDDGLSVLSKWYAKGDSQQAQDNQMALTLRSAERDGQAYLRKAKEYLNATASGIVFPIYFTSDHYTAPTTEKPADINANRKIFILT